LSWSINGKLGATVAGTIRVLLVAIPKLSTEKRRLQMNKLRFTITALAIAIFTFAFASMAQAQATRTWVSGVGDDANPCSRTAPCKTFAGAISKTATDGEIDALDSGGFGAVTITKAITIDGDSNLAGILAAGVTGVIINITASSGSNFVQLRNISFNGAGTGTNAIRILSSFANTTVSIENCVMFGFRAGNGRGISDERNVAGKLYVQDTLIKNCSGDGVVVEGVGPVKAELDNVRIINTSIGVHAAQANNIIVARNCNSSHNATGFAANGSAKMELINCMASYNNTGVNSDSGADIVLGRTTVTRNTVNGLGFSAGTIKSYGNNEVANNAGNNGPFSAGGTPLQ
jgi:hypothetical protein